VAKAVLLVKAGNGFFIAAEITFAVAAPPELPGGGDDVHALTNGRRVEIAISGDVHLHQLVAFAEIDDVVDRRLVVDHALRLEFDLRVEGALVLEIIPKIALALTQPIPIHGILL